MFVELGRSTRANAPSGLRRIWKGVIKVAVTSFVFVYVGPYSGWVDIGAEGY